MSEKEEAREMMRELRNDHEREIMAVEVLGLLEKAYDTAVQNIEIAETLEAQADRLRKEARQAFYDFTNKLAQGMRLHGDTPFKGSMELFPEMFGDGVRTWTEKRDYVRKKV